jgi:hypothetical protein
MGVPERHSKLCGRILTQSGVIGHEVGCALPIPALYQKLAVTVFNVGILCGIHWTSA